MITETDLREAIRACHAAKNPDASTCIKLASFYTILDHITGMDGYSASGSDAGGSEFAQAAEKVQKDELITVMNGLMEQLQSVCPRLYDQTMTALRRRG